jgi:hypothetical protein
MTDTANKTFRISFKMPIEVWLSLTTAESALTYTDFLAENGDRQNKRTLF